MIDSLTACQQRLGAKFVNTRSVGEHPAWLATCDACAPDYAAKEVLVERFSFASDVAFVPRGDLLDGVTVAPLTQPFEEGRSSKRRSFDLNRAVGSVGIPRPTRRSSPSWRGQEK